MEYRIIGDIHGRDLWKTLVDDDAVNIFVGDYFDSYAGTSFEETKENFLEILRYKEMYPDNVVLLYGNHDYHYMPFCKEKYSRYSEIHAHDITGLLCRNSACFHGIAYNIGEKYIVTHAGISRQWIKINLPGADKKTSVMAETINRLWQDEPDRFSFSENSFPSDYFGDSSKQSPIWIRPEALVRNNLYARNKVIQIVGHTKVNKIEQRSGILFVDCLSSCVDCAKISL